MHLKSSYYHFAKKMMVLYLSMHRGSPIGFFSPAIPTKILLQSCNLMVCTINCDPDHKCLFLVHSLNLKGPLQWMVIFSTRIDTLKSLLTVRCKFIYFHPNDIIHFRSFQSFTRITYGYSHSNDFLLLNFDHGKYHQ